MRNDHFSDRAARYAECRPGYPTALADWLASLAARRDLAWDVGCGSGQMSALLAERFARVIATDASPAQLAHARPRHGVVYAAATAEAPPLRSGAADLVVVAQAAHWFDLPRFFEEARRVARPGAAVALVGYGNAMLDDAALQDRFVRFYEGEVGSFWPPERRMIEDEYRSLAFPFDEIAAPRFELRESWTADQMLGYIETWSALRAFERAGGEARIVRDFASDLRRLWGEGTRLVRWPVPVRVGRIPGTRNHR